MAKRDWIVGSGFAIAGLGAAWLIWPDQNDLVCKKTGETLSDSQFVDRAIRATLEDYPGSAHEPRATAAIVADNAIPYDDAEEFLSVNPTAAASDREDLTDLRCQDTRSREKSSPDLSLSGTRSNTGIRPAPIPQ